ncbi:MAG: hypothetical protein GXO83_02990 [Chlorobi bacterium]|nr:hypothetical protein [Chlorobiota bacterium]
MNFQKAFKILSKDIEEIENILSGLQKSDPEEEIILKLALSKLTNLRDNIHLMSTAFPEKTKVEKETTAETKLRTQTKEKTDIPKNGITDHPVSGKLKTVLSDRYQHHQYRNESLAKKSKGKNLSTKLQEQPIKDIYKSIALNERFQYIKELFHGNGDVFNKTIQYLNQAKSLQEAEQYLNDHFDWDPDHELVQHLHELIRRKLKA